MRIFNTNLTVLLLLQTNKNWRRYSTNTKNQPKPTKIHCISIPAPTSPKECWRRLQTWSTAIYSWFSEANAVISEFSEFFELILFVLFVLF